MKMNMLSFGAQALTRQEMKLVTGGESYGTCTCLSTDKVTKCNTQIYCKSTTSSPATYELSLDWSGSRCTCPV